MPLGPALVDANVLNTLHSICTQDLSGLLLTRAICMCMYDGQVLAPTSTQGRTCSKGHKHLHAALCIMDCNFPLAHLLSGGITCKAMITSHECPHAVYTAAHLSMHPTNRHKQRSR